MRVHRAGGAHRRSEVSAATLLVPSRPERDPRAGGASASVGALCFVKAVQMDLKVKFDGEEIIITKPGTDFMLAYRKRPDSPTLKLTRSWVDPHIISPPVSEFRAQAFQAAVSKARELGWIV
jgi:hypothetical protein